MSSPTDKILSASSKALLKKMPSDDEMTEIIVGLVDGDDRTAAIMGAAYLEYGLGLLIKAAFRPLGTQEEGRIFDGAQGGILGTFSAKIRIAYAMKLLHRNPYKALLLINDIRNVFAHSLNVVDFRNPLIIDDCIKLSNISPHLTKHAKLIADKAEPAMHIYVKIIVALYLSMEQETTRLKSIGGQASTAR